MSTELMVLGVSLLCTLGLCISLASRIKALELRLEQQPSREEWIELRREIAEMNGKLSSVSHLVSLMAESKITDGR